MEFTALLIIKSNPAAFQAEWGKFLFRVMKKKVVMISII